jgi:uncharacterized membrane protein HdeD (DUF308 family)
MRKARSRIAELTKVFLIIQGCFAIIFGVLAFVWPSITIAVLAYLFAAFLLFDGLALTLVGLAGQGSNARVRLLWGLLQLFVGIVVVCNPQVSFAVFILVLGISILMRGLFSLAHAATHDDAASDDRLWHALLGALGIVAGSVIALQPAAGGLAFMWVLGLYAIITGAILIGLAFGVGRLRRKHNRNTIEY